MEVSKIAMKFITQGGRAAFGKFVSKSDKLFSKKVEAHVYQIGIIIDSEKGLFAIKGPHYQKWSDPAIYDSGLLGLPISDKTMAPDKVGAFQHFEGGSIYWHPSTGAYEVHGDIRELWKSMKWEKGLLGYPISDELKSGDDKIRYSHFQKGSILWVKQNRKTFVLSGEIAKRWRSLSDAWGLLGLPDEGDVLFTNGIYARGFEKGELVYNPMKRLAYLLTGEFCKIWQQQGGFDAKNPLGIPAGDADAEGTYQRFANGAICQSADQKSYIILSGPIYACYKSLKEHQGLLGRPTQSIAKAEDKQGQFCLFEKGVIYHHPKTGAFEVHGLILKKWKELGAEKSALGYPLSNELVSPDGKGRYSKFQKGGLIWYPKKAVQIDEKADFKTDYKISGQVTDAKGKAVSAPLTAQVNYSYVELGSAANSDPGTGGGAGGGGTKSVPLNQEGKYALDLGALFATNITLNVKYAKTVLATQQLLSNQEKIFQGNAQEYKCDLKVDLGKATSIPGRVVDQNSHLGIADLTVKAYLYEPKQTYFLGQGKTDAEGNFEVPVYQLGDKDQVSFRIFQWEEMQLADQIQAPAKSPEPAPTPKSIAKKIDKIAAAG